MSFRLILQYSIDFIDHQTPNSDIYNTTVTLIQDVHRFINLVNYDSKTVNAAKIRLKKRSSLEIKRADISTEQIIIWNISLDTYDCTGITIQMQSTKIQNTLKLK